MLDRPPVAVSNCSHVTALCEFGGQLWPLLGPFEVGQILKSQVVDSPNEWSKGISKDTLVTGHMSYLWASMETPLCNVTRSKIKSLVQEMAHYCKSVIQYLQIS